MYVSRRFAIKLVSNFRRIATASTLHGSSASIKYEKICWPTTSLPRRYNHAVAPRASQMVVKEVENGFEIVVPAKTNFESGTKPVFVDYVWLRDHCQCDQCYNWQTFQRENGPQHIDETIQPISWSLDAGDNLKVEWPGHHKSSFAINWLEKNIFDADGDRPKLSIKHWNRDLKQKDYPHVKYIEESNADEFAHQVLSNLIVYGFCLIHEVVPNLEQVRRICSKIAPILNGFWGDVWTVQTSNKDSKWSDSAFSNVGLPLHTDCTYFTEAPGLQVFCRLDSTAIGGETVLADGFYAANRLKVKHPEAYEHLSTVPFESTYMDKSGNYFSHYDTVLKHNPFSSDIMQIRFNPLDVAPLGSIPQKDIRTHYRSYTQVSNEINDPENSISLMLKTGTMLVFDNWRVLHGRKSFTGERILGGCYIGRAEYYSKARKLGLV